MLHALPRTPRKRPLFEPLLQLNAYEQALNDAWGKDGGAVGDAVNNWIAHLIQGAHVDTELLRREVDAVIASNAERRTSPAAVVQECRILFTKLGLDT